MMTRRQFLSRSVALGLMGGPAGRLIASAQASEEPPLADTPAVAAGDRILVVSDSPKYYSTRDLQKLYPGAVEEHDLNQGPVTPQLLAPYRRVWTLIRRSENVAKLDYQVIREHARRGARVVSHLYEYAHGSGLEFRFQNAGGTRHKLRMVAESDPVTRGFAVGDEVYWYRNSTDIDEPPVGHYAYREVVCDDDPGSGRRVLARSTVTGGAMWVEERFPSGGALLAYDLFSPLNLCTTQGDPWVLDRGTFAKYLPAGNLFGGSVRYGRYQNRKLTPEEVNERIRALADLPGKVAKVEIREEGKSSEGTPILSVRCGNEQGPRFQLVSVKHGMEWENLYGSLVTLERVLRGEVLDLERYCVVGVPLLNPFGYRHGCRHNANGVDLNRQLSSRWDRFRGWTDEVIAPWTFDYKGTSVDSEPEAKLEERLWDEPNRVCYIDAHEMAGAPTIGGSGPRTDVFEEFCRRIAENMKNRYLVRHVADESPRQFNLESYPGKPGGEDVGKHSVYNIWYENSGQLPDVHATVMQTDFAAEANITIMKTIAEAISEGKSGK